MRLSVLIPNLHSPRIGETITAILAQQRVHEAFEVVVVGRDKYNLIPNHPNVVAIETERNLNPAEARNEAIRHARGEVCLFLDSDCVPEPTWMAAMLAARKAGADVVGGALTFDRDGYWSVADNIAAAHGFLPSTPAGPPNGFHLSCANLCVDRAHLQAVDGLREELVCGEDFDLMMRLKGRGLSMHFEPTARAAHRHVRTSLRRFIDHAAAWAPYSIKVRHDHADALNTPWMLRGPWRLRLLSPAIALAVTLRIWWRHPELLADLHTMPAVYGAKIIWCWAAAKGLQNLPERGA